MQLGRLLGASVREGTGPRCYHIWMITGALEHPGWVVLGLVALLGVVAIAVFARGRL